MAPPEKELHQRDPLRPRMRNIHGGRCATGASKTASWRCCHPALVVAWRRLWWWFTGGGEGEVVDLGAEEGELWVGPRRRAVVREPPKRRRGGRGGEAAVHRLHLLSSRLAVRQGRAGPKRVGLAQIFVLYRTRPRLVN